MVFADVRSSSRTSNQSVQIVNVAATAVSEKMTCLVLGHQTADGPANMAFDEALLETVSAGLGTALLRTYGWTTPTLSLGYFQNLDEVQADSRFQSVPMVRRLTGGGAIWHHHELTYALVVPADHPLVRPSTGLYQRSPPSHRRGHARSGNSS